MKDLTFKSLREANIERAKQYKSACEMDANFFLLCIFGEVGELCNFIKKERRDNKSYEQEIRKELADIVIYMDLLAEKMQYKFDNRWVASFDNIRRHNEPHLYRKDIQQLARNIFKMSVKLPKSKSWFNVMLSEIDQLAAAYTCNLGQEIRNKFNEVSDRIGVQVYL